MSESDTDRPPHRIDGQSCRLGRYGPNDAATVQRSPLILQFLARLRNPLIIILLVASGLSAASGDIASFVIVIAIVTSSITLDFVQEIRAQNAVEALRRSVAVQATVRRDGSSVSLPIDQLVPGDIVELIAGDLVPADSRLLESRDLFVNQALLAGEPYPAEKLAGDATSGAENPAGASNAVFAGTSVISGTATILICRTGSRTALGHLATSLAEKPPATAFAIGIREFGMLIVRFTDRAAPDREIDRWIGHRVTHHWENTAIIHWCLISRRSDRKSRFSGDFARWRIGKWTMTGPL